MLFKDFCNILEKVEATASRLEMTALLKDLYLSLDVEEVQIVSYLLLGRVAPMFVPAEFNFSEKSLLNVYEGHYSNAQNLRDELGDIGLVAEELSSGSGEKVSVRGVYEALWEVVNTIGTGSHQRTSLIVSSVIMSLSPIEAKYFARIVSGKLRLGVSVKTLLDAFSFAIAGDKSVSEELNRAYGVSADLGYIAKVVFQDIKKAVGALGEVKITPGIPLLSRLVERVKTFDEVFERLGDEVLVQPKFDGLRCQIHKVDGSFDDATSDRLWSSRLVDETGGEIGLFGGASESSVRLFTRNLEDVTHMFPEIVSATKALPMKSCVLDSEVIGWDQEANTFKSYQETMFRKRKHGVEGASTDTPVKAFVFGIMYKDGKGLTEVDTVKRVEILEGSMEGVEGDILLAETKRMSKGDGLDGIFTELVDKGLEGLIVKKLEGQYLPGVRNYDWLKLKKSMFKSLVDTVDLVVMGYYYGSGKRADFGIGAILGGVYSKEEDRYESCTKIGTGISDEMLAEIKERLDGILVKEVPKEYLIDERLKPDMVVSPEIVVTVEADEISKGKGTTDSSPAKGLSLRFPRLIEFGRDKNPDGATSVSELWDMFKLSRDNS